MLLGNTSAPNIQALAGIDENNVAISLNSDRNIISNVVNRNDVTTSVDIDRNKGNDVTTLFNMDRNAATTLVISTASRCHLIHKKQIELLSWITVAVLLF